MTFNTGPERWGSPGNGSSAGGRRQFQAKEIQTKTYDGKADNQF